MDNGVAVKISKVSKHYYLNHRTALMKILDRIFSRGRVESEEAQEIWALKDVSMEIRKGETFGIIGKNGAGKSTLLTIISNIAKPSSGYITVEGKIISLLQIGAGFHPELTGKENVYMNGALMGMNKKQIKSKMDEIVEFAEIGRFMNTPVKYYSSGMKARLGFSIASTLESDIIIIDEALAVGDQQFKDKSADKIKEITEGGRTVIFVSHAMPQIKRLCERTAYLKQGELVFVGSTDEAIKKFNGDTLHKKK